jgi:hypothetical protein
LEHPTDRAQTFSPVFCARCGDELDHGLVAGEGFAAPVDADVAEQAVLDFVPLRGAGTMIRRPVRSARRWSSVFHSRARLPLEPPQSAAIVNVLAPGNRARPRFSHDARIDAVANWLVS